MYIYFNKYLSLFFCYFGSFTCLLLYNKRITIFNFAFTKSMLMLHGKG